MPFKQILAIVIIDILFGIGAYMNDETGIAIVCSIGAIIGIALFLLLKVISE